MNFSQFFKNLNAVEDPAPQKLAAPEVPAPEAAKENTLSTPTTTQTWLQKAGTVLRKMLGIGVEVAEAAEPEVDLAFPAVAALYNGTVGFFVQSEAAYGATPGQGAAKLASALPAIEANLTAWATNNGYTVVAADVQKWASAFADTLNLLPITKS